MSWFSVWLHANYTVLKDFAAPLATVIAATAAAGVAFRFGKKQAQVAQAQVEVAKAQLQIAMTQPEIAKAQVEIARAQAAIAQRNWETSNDKVVLELFERRYAILQSMREAVGEVLGSGEITQESLSKFYRGVEQAPFLFGDDVTQFVEEIGKAMSEVSYWNRRLANANQTEAEKYTGRREQAFQKVESWVTRYVDVFKPYLRAHQTSGGSDRE